MQKVFVSLSGGNGANTSCIPLYHSPPVGREWFGDDTTSGPWLTYHFAPWLILGKSFVFCFDFSFHSFTYFNCRPSKIGSRFRLSL